MKCYICNKEIHSRNGKHIFFCDKEITDKSTKKIKLLKHNNLLIDKAILIKLYVEDGLSANEIYTKIYEMPSSIFYFLLELYQIQKRTIKQSANMVRNLEQRKKTSFERFGVDNAAKSEIIKQKVRNTFLKNYGVSNIFKDEAFKKSIPDLMIAKYGVKSLPNRYGNYTKWWAKQDVAYRKRIGRILGDCTSKRWKALTKEEQDLIIQKRARNGSSVGRGKSRLEERVARILLANNITHIRQKWIGRRSFDFRIENTNILIEVNGDYFHANPKFYKEDDLVISFKNYKVEAKEIWANDFLKKELAEKYGYKVHYIWECDMEILTDAELYVIIASIIREHYEDKINKEDR